VIDAAFDSALRESAVEVLEKMFFISDVAVPVFECNCAAPEIAARLTFDGSSRGWLALRIGKLAARSIAADFLGEEVETLTDRQAEEMVCEMANMICGSVLSRTESDATFRLASPLVVPIADWPEPQGAVVHRVALAGGALTIFMKADIPVCQSNEKFAS
jgi:CheY-specific phosphatase CheX